jgi:ATP-dependent exoDNAse (exonuclease V) alpha subunit
VLVATNDVRNMLNGMLQEQFNPNPGDKTTPFRVNDKVIFLSNTDLPFATLDKRDSKTWKQSDDKAKICNGDMGRVLFANAKQTVVQFDSQDKPILIYRGKTADDSDSEPQTEGENARANGKRDAEQQKQKTKTGCDLDLAYAVTTHKSQGSQWPIAIYLIEEGQIGEFGNVDRAHVYTGISRAQKATFIVGQIWAVNAACRRTFINRRKTFMVETIREMAAKESVRLRIQEADLW